MKKSFIYLVLGFAFLASCSGNDKKQLEEDSLRILQLTQEYDQAATFNDSLMLLMSDIYNGLDSINMQEGLLNNINNGENVDRRAEVRQNLSNIKARLASNRKLLAQMEAKIKAAGNENSVMAKTIAQMKERLEQQDSKIAMLEGELTQAQETIAVLNDQVEQTQQQLAVQTEIKDAAVEAAVEANNQLNTVYYAIGTNKELKQNGLLEKKFLGQTKVLRGDFNESYFTKADKRTLTSINTGAKKIKIWTNMPSDSYEEVKNADKTITINITNPQEFWSLSPFLVIQVD